MKTIIKGLIYKNGDELLRPHYSGEFSMVDCTEFKLKKDIKKDYDKQYADQFLKGNSLTCDGVKYFECEFSPHHTDAMELLSDLSEVEYFDEETDFKS